MPNKTGPKPLLLSVLKIGESVILKGDGYDGQTYRDFGDFSPNDRLALSNRANTNVDETAQSFIDEAIAGNGGERTLAY